MKKPINVILCTLFFITCITGSSCTESKVGNTDNGHFLEIPAINADDEILRYEGFVLSYDTKALIPKWVAYELTAEKVAGTEPRANGFSMDPSYRKKQAMREDYSNSGWDKGHMAPAADMRWSRTAMKESFYLTNICPQDHELNGHDWNTLEKNIRNLAVEYGKVWIVCGPIIGENRYGTIGRNRVIVPDAFFKAILVKDGNAYRSAAYVMDNRSGHHSMKSYSMSVDELEKITGLDFFCSLDEDAQKIAEASCTTFF